jgi:hypothetical protein
MVFCLQNECKRKFCGEIAKIIQREITKVERREIRETKRTIEICKCFACATQVSIKRFVISFFYLFFFFPLRDLFRYPNLRKLLNELEKTKEIARKL